MIVVRTHGRQVLRLMVDEPLEIGPECDGLVIADARVSRRHLVVDADGRGGLKLTDLGSSNGTFVGGEQITATTTLAAGESATLGDTTVQVAAVGGPSPADVGTGNRTSIDSRPDGELLRTSIDVVAESIVGDITPELVGVEDEAGTLTIVFSDIEDSTVRAMRLGDRQWLDVLTDHNRLVETHVRAHHGRIVKNQGDGFMLSFRSARQAVLASIGIQRDLHRLAAGDTTEGVRVRIGMHTGEVLMDGDGDIFGKHVMIAARVGAIARGGSILVTSLVKQITEPRADLVFREPVDAELKGIGHVVTVYEVDWEQSVPA